MKCFTNGGSIKGEDFRLDITGVINVPFSETLEVTEEHVKNHEIRNRAVLIHTGWDRNWNTEKYFENHPYLTGGAAFPVRAMAKLAKNNP